MLALLLAPWGWELKLQVVGTLRLEVLHHVVGTLLLAPFGWVLKLQVVGTLGHYFLHHGGGG